MINDHEWSGRTDQIRIYASICKVMRIISLLLVTIYITLIGLNLIRFCRIDHPM